MNAVAHPGRLRWRCRRGMRELDVLLGRFLEERWTVASDAERAQFERILQLPDPQLAAYLTGREPAPDPELEAMLELLRHLARQPVARAVAAAASGS